MARQGRLAEAAGVAGTTQLGAEEAQDGDRGLRRLSIRHRPIVGRPVFAPASQELLPALGTGP
jgi:hypothetical protein